MTARLLAAAFALALAPFAARADEIDNPFRNAKVGDYAVYKMTTKIGDLAIGGTVTQTVTAKTDKEATLKVTANVNGMDTPAQEQKIDLTKPFDPTKAGSLPPNADIKVEKLKEGKEKVKVGGKEYDSNWTTFKVKGKVMGLAIDADVKAWIAKEIPTGMAKMEMAASIAGMKMEMKMELSETGNKK